MFDVPPLALSSLVPCHISCVGLLVRNGSFAGIFWTNIKYEGFGEDKCIVVFRMESGHNGGVESNRWKHLYSSNTKILL